MLSQDMHSLPVLATARTLRGFNVMGKTVNPFTAKLHELKYHTCTELIGLLSHKNELQLIFLK